MNTTNLILQHVETVKLIYVTLNTLCIFSHLFEIVVFALKYLLNVKLMLALSVSIIHFKLLCERFKLF